MTYGLTKLWVDMTRDVDVGKLGVGKSATGESEISSPDIRAPELPSLAPGIMHSLRHNQVKRRTVSGGHSSLGNVAQ